MFVKEVEFTTQEEDANQQAPPGQSANNAFGCCVSPVKTEHITFDLWLGHAGQTELPTCPVCLERLDEHISGVVTTVSPYQFMLDVGSCLELDSMSIAMSREFGALLLHCADQTDL